MRLSPLSGSTSARNVLSLIFNTQVSQWSFDWSGSQFRILSLLLSLRKLSILSTRGGEVRLFLFRLNLSMFSPNTSPVLRADMRSSNSVWSCPCPGGWLPFWTGWPLVSRPALLFLRSKVLILICKRETFIKSRKWDTYCAFPLGKVKR